MTNPELTERVRELRERGRTPKEIAKALGLPPATVAPLIRAVAATQPKREARLVGCWVNQGWAAGLSITGHTDWPGARATAESGGSGLVNILVARDGGSTVSVCGYLVDTWCLGVKDTLGPKSMDRRKLPGFTDLSFRTYDQPPLAYARGLGFEPHPDFAGCTSHLGPWEGPSDITFGLDGKPMYIQGPNDNAARVLRTLRRSVGKGNYQYLGR